MKSIFQLEEINQDFPAKQTFQLPLKYQTLGVEFENDPVWHAKKVKTNEKIIGKKALGF